MFWPLILVLVFLIPQSNAEETNEEWKDWGEQSIINVSIVGNSVINMDSNDRLIRAYVDILNFDPSDGYYYMQIIQTPTNKIIVEKEIVVREKGNGQAGVDVGYMIPEDAIYENGIAIQGDYSIEVFSEYGTSIGSAIFSIIKPSEPNFLVVDESTELDELTSELNEQIDNVIEAESEVDPQLESELENIKKIPDWVNNIFVLYIDGSITEDELISALKFLIEQGIIEISI